MTYNLSMTHLPGDWNVAVVGCGGTGGFVAEGLCRLLEPKRDIFLIDHDRVEAHNLRRQNFYEGDIGKFKSQALAERLARNYGREIGYSVYPFLHDSMVRAKRSLRDYLINQSINGLIIGCVDNATARRDLENAAGIYRWWIDAGNGHHSGQVLIGNATDPTMLSLSFKAKDETITRLPAPSLQLPSLLIPAPDELKAPEDCAQAVAADDQSPLINQAMAMLVLEFVSRLITGKLNWMGAYLDLEAGSLSTVPAEPKTVSKMTGVPVRTLIDNKNK